MPPSTPMTPAELAAFHGIDPCADCKKPGELSDVYRTRKELRFGFYSVGCSACIQSTGAIRGKLAAIALWNARQKVCI